MKARNISKVVNNRPEIVRNNESIKVIKENKTIVNYFIFNEYEIHLNTIPANAMQEWHYHSSIEEVILVTKGILTCKWLDEEEIAIDTINIGDIVRVKNSIHTFENTTKQDCEFIVFRLVLDGKDKRKVIKNDKKIVEIKENE